MNTLSATLLVGLLTASIVGARADSERPQTQSVSPGVARWLSAVDSHIPGLNDQALQTMKSLSPGGFAAVTRALANRRQAVRRPQRTPFNRLVHRGALLHMDVAMVLADDVMARPLRVPGALSSRHDGGVVD